MTTFCPNCVQSMKVDDFPLVDVVCPRCGVLVRSAPTPRSAAGQSAAGSSVGWQTTSFALKTQFGCLLMLLIGMAAALGLNPPGEGPAGICMGGVLLLVYFLALCVCASAPDPTARRSALACVLTLVLGTFGVFGIGVAVVGPNEIGLPRALAESAFAFGIFTVYYSAFVFLMRFHATIARVFGNRRLRRQCYIYLFAPFVVLAGNYVLFWLTEPFFLRQRPAPFFIPPNLAAVLQPTFNFAVVGWYAVILLQTFRTIDRGLVAEPGYTKRTEMGEDDLSID